MPDTVTGAECTVEEAHPPPSRACPPGRETSTRQTYSPHWMLVVMSLEEEKELDKG